MLLPCRLLCNGGVGDGDGGSHSRCLSRGVRFQAASDSPVQSGSPGLALLLGGGEAGWGGSPGHPRSTQSSGPPWGSLRGLGWDRARWQERLSPSAKDKVRLGSQHSALPSFTLGTQEGAHVIKSICYESSQMLCPLGGWLALSVPWFPYGKKWDNDTLPSTPSGTVDSSLVSSSLSFT